MAGQRKAVIAALKKRGIDRIVYLHTDHFEPWRTVAGEPEGLAGSVAQVEHYARSIEALDYARRPTLFLKSNVNFAVDDERELYRAAPEDRLGFVPRSDADREKGRQIMAPLVAGEAEIQLHLHHENFVWNASLRDPATSDYLRTPLGRSLDSARVELAVRLNLALIEEDGGPKLTKWFFVHGHWALNASDPDECTIVREIELLMRNGGLGDFTQPAGRPHVDSRIGEPYLVRPVPVAKGYDSALGDPVVAAGAGGAPADRFFIWASELSHRDCSIDIHSGFVKERAAKPGKFALAHAEKGLVVDGALYVKTHAHSMAPAYWNEEGKGVFPHAHPAIRAELANLFDWGGAAGCEVEFATAAEAYQRILGASAGPSTDLVERWGVDDQPMCDVGVTVVHRDRNGRLVEAPPLSFRAPKLAQPRKAGAGGEVSVALPEIAALGAANPPPPVAPAPEPVEALGDDQVNGLARAINPIASDVAAERLRELGGAGSGVTGFYEARGREGSILQKAELRLAALIAERTGRDAPVWEIGSGLSLLSLLLASDGFRAVALERNLARLETGKAIAERYRRTLQNAPDLTFVHGVFPAATRGKWGLSSSSALVTNLLGSADEAAQRRFIRGLRVFGSVYVDLQRFFVRRSGQGGFAGLIQMFREEGFPEPRPVLDLGSDGYYVLFGRASVPIASRQGLRLRADRLVSRLRSR